MVPDPPIYDERLESRSWNLKDGRGTVEYQLIGVHDDLDAASYCRANTPVFFHGAWLQDIQLKPQGNGLWYVTCPYGPLPKMPGSYKISFRTTGGTVKISVAQSMVAKYGTGAPDTVVIGQDNEGAEITVPVQLRSYAYNFAQGCVTELMMDYWEDLTGVVNLSTWHNRPAGEVLFLGAEGDTTLSADSSSTVTFHMAMSRNKTGMTIGSLTSIAKQGHDLIDIHVESTTSGGKPVKSPKYVYVQRVYDRVAFATCLGF